MNKARIAGVFCLLTFLTGGFALVVRSRLGVAAGLVAGACYIAVSESSAIFANHLSPYSFAPGILVEGALTVWLLMFGLNVPRSQEQAASQVHV